MASPEMVLSVSAGETYHLILEHFIYSCPDDNGHRYDDTEFIAFRQGDGTMTRLFRIEQEVRIVPAEVLTASSLPDGLRERIVGYLSVARNRGIIETPQRPYRFYVLNEEEVEELPHRPHTEPRSQGAIYFDRAELKAGRSVVKPLK